MAIAKIEYICSECGETATRRVEKRNSQEAREYEEWFKSLPEHICPDCYAKHQRETKLHELSEVLKGCTLPEIEGKSEKQIKYADDCRTKRLMDDIINVQKALKLYTPCEGLIASKNTHVLVNRVHKMFPDVRQSELLTVIFQNPMLFYLIETEARNLIDGPMILDNYTQYNAIRAKVTEEYKIMKAIKAKRMKEQL